MSESRKGREEKKSATDQQTRKEHRGRLIQERFDFRDSRRLNYTLSRTERIDGAREEEKSKEIIKSYGSTTLNATSQEEKRGIRKRNKLRAGKLKRAKD